MSLIEPPSLRIATKIVQSGFDSTTVIYIICIALLLLISALMSGSESAFFSLRPADNEDLKKENSSRSKLILSLLSKPKELLATILITNNFVKQPPNSQAPAKLGEWARRDEQAHTLLWHGSKLSKARCCLSP